jgi:hypothetical protein
MDWSTHHVIYTNHYKGSSPQAAMAEQVSKSHYDPRLFNSWLLQGHLPPAASSSAATSTTKSAALASQNTIAQANVTKKSKGPAPTRDWSLSLGAASGVAANMYPAKFSFNINSGPDCINDYVVFGLNAAGSATQANLVGVNELYSGSSPTGLCGAAPHVYWAYNVTTLTGGKVTTSPVLSLDGTLVAFVESNGSASVLHVLKWLANNGTVAAPVTPTAATSVGSCTAPCMVSLEYDNSHGTTLSSPFYDYQQDDAIYIGNDNGKLFQILGVFGGTPAVSTINGWSASGVTLGAASVKMTGPIWDVNTGNIFVGGSDGKLYAVNFQNASTSESIAVGSGSANGGGIADSPIIDSSSGTVFAFAMANAANVGGTTLAVNTSAVTLQASMATPFTSPQVATMGQGSKGTTTSLNVAAGTFDNDYYTWSGTGGNNGILYMIGTAAAATYPTLYQLPFSGIASVALTGNGSGYTTPTVSISDTTGKGATVTASGGVTGVGVTAAGSGYTSIPTAAFGAAPSGGTNASGSAVSVGVNAVTVTATGSGYTAVPTVNFGGTGSGATATASLGVGSVAINSGGVGYTAVPTVTAPGGTTNATLAASVGTSTLNVTAGGSYTTLPTVTFTGGGTGTSRVGVNTIAVSAGGSNYTSPPTVTVNGAGTGGGAASGVLGVDAATISAGGTYTALPTVAFPGGTTNATGTTLVGLQSIGVTAGGSFTAIPAITVTGTGSGGSATAAVGVTAVGVTSGGSGYTSVPAVTFGGTGSGAAATASLGVGTVAVTGGGSGYTSVPTVSFAGTGSGTTATAALGVASAALTAGGSYTSLPTVSISGSGGSGTTTSLSVGVSSVAVTADGTGYTAFPAVSFAGTGSGATATATVGVATISVPAPTAGTGSVTVTASSGWNSNDTVTIGSVTYTAEASQTSSHCTGSTPCMWYGTTAANSAQTLYAAVTANPANCPSGVSGTWTHTCYNGNISSANASVTATYSGAVVNLTNATSGVVALSTNTTDDTVSPATGGIPAPVSNGSAGCTAGTQSLTFSGAGGSGATGTATISGGVVQSVTLTASGSGYTAIPTFTVNTCTTQPTTRTLTAKVTGVSVTAAGSYTTFPTISFSGTGGSGTTATVTATVESVSVSAPGTGYTAVPTVTFAPTGASATAALEVVTVSVTAAGSGYTSVPTVTFSGAPTTSATATASLKVVSVAVTSAGSYTTFPTASVTGATVTTTVTIESVNVGAAGSYSTYPGATTTGGATLSVTGATVVSVSVATPGTGYTSGPITLTFTGAGAGGAAGTADLKVVSISVTAPGSYTAIPTATITGNATLGAVTATVVGVTVTTPGSTTTYPTVTFSGSGGATATVSSVVVVNVAVSAPGTGYTALPTVTFSTSGSTTSATATASLGVSTVAVNASGAYTTFPTASIAAGSGGSGTTLTLTANVAAVGPPATSGSGYTTAPAITFSGGGGSGAAGTSTINVSAIKVTWGGGGYTAPTVTITDSGSGSGATASVTVNPGTVMTAGVNPTNCATTSTYCYQIDNSAGTEPASPINEIYNPSITPPADLLFYSFGTSTVGVVYSQPVTGGAISTSPASYNVNPPAPGTSGIVVDNVSSSSQASSIYFGTLGTQVLGTGPETENVASATSSGSLFGSTNTATITLASTPPVAFQVGQTVTVAGVVCSGSPCTQTFEGNFTILTASGLKFTYDIATCAIGCFGETADASKGTATATENISDYSAIKLTQSALQ